MLASQGGFATDSEIFISQYFWQFLTKNLLNIFILDSAKYASVLFVLKTCVDGGTQLDFWLYINNFAIAFFYWALLSANLLGETLYELKAETQVNRVSSIFTSPYLAVKYIKLSHILIFAIDVGLKLLLALFLQSLFPLATFGNHAW